MAKFTRAAPDGAAPKDGAPNAGAWRVFIETLAQAPNVAAAARAAGVSTWDVYKRRQTHTAFQREWRKALAEGYARLEAQLLDEALRTVGGTVKANTLTARAQKHRLGLFLLGQHRASVRGDGAARPPSAPPARPLSRKIVIATLEARLAQARERLEQAGA